MNCAKGNISSYPVFYVMLYSFDIQLQLFTITKGQFLFPRTNYFLILYMKNSLNKGICNTSHYNSDPSWKSVQAEVTDKHSIFLFISEAWNVVINLSESAYLNWTVWNDKICPQNLWPLESHRIYIPINGGINWVHLSENLVSFNVTGLFF